MGPSHRRSLSRENRHGPKFTVWAVLFVAVAAASLHHPATAQMPERRGGGGPPTPAGNNASWPHSLMGRGTSGLSPAVLSGNAMPPPPPKSAMVSLGHTAELATNTDSTAKGNADVYDDCYNAQWSTFNGGRDNGIQCRNGYLMTQFRRASCHWLQQPCLPEIKCCRPKQPYNDLNKSATCLSRHPSTWGTRRRGVVSCPRGEFLNGWQKFKNSRGMFDIHSINCCKNNAAKLEWRNARSQSVWSQFDRPGWSGCQNPGEYITGYWQNYCSYIFCLEVFYCAKLKLGCPNDCTGNGVCDDKQRCQCHTGWTGVDCAHSHTVRLPPKYGFPPKDRKIQQPKLKGAYREVNELDACSMVENGATKVTRDNNLWHNFGERRWKKVVKFKKAFYNPPLVTVGIKGIDVYLGNNYRADVYAEKITTEQMTIVIQAWGRTRWYYLTTSWVAFGNEASCSKETVAYRESLKAGTDYFIKLNTQQASVDEQLHAIKDLHFRNMGNLGKALKQMTTLKQRAALLMENLSSDSSSERSRLSAEMKAAMSFDDGVNKNVQGNDALQAKLQAASGTDLALVDSVETCMRRELDALTSAQEQKIYSKYKKFKRRLQDIDLFKSEIQAMVVKMDIMKSNLNIYKLRKANQDRIAKESGHPPSLVTNLSKQQCKCHKVNHMGPPEGIPPGFVIDEHEPATGPHPRGMKSMALLQEGGIIQPSGRSLHHCLCHNPASPNQPSTLQLRSAT